MPTQKDPVASFFGDDGGFSQDSEAADSPNPTEGKPSADPDPYGQLMEKKRDAERDRVIDALEENQGKTQTQLAGEVRGGGLIEQRVARGNIPREGGARTQQQLSEGGIGPDWQALADANAPLSERVENYAKSAIRHGVPVATGIGLSIPATAAGTTAGTAVGGPGLGIVAGNLARSESFAGGFVLAEQGMRMLYDESPLTKKEMVDLGVNAAAVDAIFGAGAELGKLGLRGFVNSRLGAALMDEYLQVKPVMVDFLKKNGLFKEIKVLSEQQQAVVRQLGDRLVKKMNAMRQTVNKTLDDAVNPIIKKMGDPMVPVRRVTQKNAAKLLKNVEEFASPEEAEALKQFSEVLGLPRVSEFGLGGPMRIPGMDAPLKNEIPLSVNIQLGRIFDRIRRKAKVFQKAQQGQGANLSPEFNSFIREINSLSKSFKVTRRNTGSLPLFLAFRKASKFFDHMDDMALELGKEPRRYANKVISLFNKDSSDNAAFREAARKALKSTKEIDDIMLHEAKRIFSRPASAPPRLTGVLTGSLATGLVTGGVAGSKDGIGANDIPQALATAAVTAGVMGSGLLALSNPNMWIKIFGAMQPGVRGGIGSSIARGSAVSGISKMTLGDKVNKKREQK